MVSSGIQFSHGLVVRKDMSKLICSSNTKSTGSLTSGKGHPKRAKMCDFGGGQKCSYAMFLKTLNVWIFPWQKNWRFHGWEDSYSTSFNRNILQSNRMFFFKWKLRKAANVVSHIPHLPVSMSTHWGFHLMPQVFPCLRCRMPTTVGMRNGMAKPRSSANDLKVWFFDVNGTGEDPIERTRVHMNLIPILSHP